jgi:hypothetical protein
VYEEMVATGSTAPVRRYFSIRENRPALTELMTKRLGKLEQAVDVHQDCGFGFKQKGYEIEC